MSCAMLQFASVALVLLAAQDAAAGQSAGTAADPAQSRPSFNLGVAVVGGDDMPAASLSIGTDVPIGPRGGVRIEVGRRIPGRTAATSHPTYYLDHPSASEGGAPPVPVEATSRTTEQTLADVAFLARVALHRQRRVEAAGLAGLDLHLLRFRHNLTVPRSLTDPMDVEVSDVSRRVLRGVFDLGIEGGFRLTSRTTLLVFGLVGLQSPYEEHRRAQRRAGVILKRRF